MKEPFRVETDPFSGPLHLLTYFVLERVVDPLQVSLSPLISLYSLYRKENHFLTLEEGADDLNSFALIGLYKSRRFLPAGGEEEEGLFPEEWERRKEILSFLPHLYEPLLDRPVLFEKVFPRGYRSSLKKGDRKAEPLEKFYLLMKDLYERSQRVYSPYLPAFTPPSIQHLFREMVYELSKSPLPLPELIRLGKSTLERIYIFLILLEGIRLGIFRWENRTVFLRSGKVPDLSLEGFQERYGTF